MNFEYRESAGDLVLPFGDHRNALFEGEITKNIHCIIEKALVEFSSQSQYRKFRNPSLEKYRKQVQENEKRLTNLFGPCTYDPSVEYYLSDDEGIGEKKVVPTKKKNTSTSSKNNPKQIRKKEKVVITRTPLLMKKKKSFFTFQKKKNSAHLSRSRRDIMNSKNTSTRTYQQRRSLSSYHTQKRNHLARIRKRELLIRQKKKRPSSTHDLMAGRRRNSVGSNTSTNRRTRGRGKRRDSAPPGIKVKVPGVSSSSSALTKKLLNGNNSAKSTSKNRFGRSVRNISFLDSTRVKKVSSSSSSSSISKKQQRNHEIMVFSKNLINNKGRGSNWGRNSIGSFDRGYISNLRREIKKKNKRRKLVLGELKKEKLNLQKKLNDFKRKNQRKKTTSSSSTNRMKRRNINRRMNSSVSGNSKGSKIMIPREIKSDYRKYLDIKKKIKDLESLGDLVSTRKKKKRK